MDRRQERTRRTLRTALVALILRKGYDATTIQDIIDEANVGRSTFYAHFTGKDDLFREGFVQLRELLQAQRAEVVNAGQISDGDALGFSLPMFRHVKDHGELYAALVGERGGAIAIHEVRALLADLAEGDLKNLFKDRALAKSERELVLQFIVGAFMSVLIWWLDKNARLSPEQVDSAFRSLALSGIDALRTGRS